MNLNLSFTVSESEKQLPAALLLDAHRDIAFNNAERGLRHPTAIYNVAISNVVDTFRSLLDLLEQDARDRGAIEPRSTQLARAVDHLLDAVMEHFDDCENVIKLFHEDSNQAACGKALRSWGQTVRECRDFVAKQVNSIKHNQGRLRLIEFQWADGQTLGYFVEGVLKDGSVGPNPNVHRGGNSAYSFVRALRYLICTIVFASRALCIFLRPMAREEIDTTRHGLGPLTQIVPRVLNIGLRVFPDEAAGATPRIESRLDRVLIQYPCARRNTATCAGACAGEAWW